MADRSVFAAVRSAMRYVVHPFSRLLAAVLVLFVRIYQKAISPFLGNHCRFHPSCSQYYILAVQKHGPLRGSLKGLWRICRCHPGSRGGEDWP